MLATASRLERPILIVDDDPGILLLLSDVLHEEGYSVVTACDGISALSVAQWAQPGVLLLDIRLPGVNGVDLAQQLKERGVDAKIVVMTSPLACRVAEEIGADDYLEKPFGLATFLRSVEAAAAA
jgi:two-component system response regulator (stage 0 sporulation protein F)